MIRMQQASFLKFEFIKSKRKMIPRRAVLVDRALEAYRFAEIRSSLENARFGSNLSALFRSEFILILCKTFQTPTKSFGRRAVHSDNFHK